MTQLISIKRGDPQHPFPKGTAPETRMTSHKSDNMSAQPEQTPSAQFSIQVPKNYNTMVLSSADTLTRNTTSFCPWKEPDNIFSSENPSLDSSICPTPHTAETLHLTRTSTLPSPYFLLPLWRKCLIVFTLSFTALAATFSSTSLFSVVSEISADLHASPSTISLSNAGVLLLMGCSSFVWGPIGRLIGRRWSWISASAVFLVCIIGTAVAPNESVFIALRLLGGLQGTSFHVAGQSMLADLFEPVQRGTATGFFLAGTVFGPPFGPCIAGVIVNFTTWRAILWLQAGMMGLSLVLSLSFLPDIKRSTKDHVAEEDHHRSVWEIVKEFDARKVFKPMIYPNILLTHLTCGFLSWSQYTLLAAPRHLLNPRFHWDKPLFAGLFYIAPGCGFLIGTVVGGKWSDITVRKWIKTRAGLRLPQDRLNSGMFTFFFLIPASSLTYGWSLDREVGGLALPIVTAFFCAAGLLIAFASVNTYCAEALPKQRNEVIAGKYLVQYTFGAIGSAAIIPSIDAIGMGPSSTIGVVFVVVGGILTLLTARNGLAMQLWMEGRIRRSDSEKLPK